MNANQAHCLKRKLAEEKELAFLNQGHLNPEQEELRCLR